MLILADRQRSPVLAVRRLLLRYQQHDQAPSADGKCSQLLGAAPAHAARPAVDAECKRDRASPAAAYRGDSLRISPI